jgi:hypothetical protein
MSKFLVQLVRFMTTLSGKLQWKLCTTEYSTGQWSNCLGRFPFDNDRIFSMSIGTCKVGFLCTAVVLDWDLVASNCSRLIKTRWMYCSYRRHAEWSSMLVKSLYLSQILFHFRNNTASGVSHMSELDWDRSRIVISLVLWNGRTRVEAE